MQPDLPAAYRERFPILERQVYLNSCSQGALSRDVRRAYQDYLRDWEERGSPWELWVERGEAARAAFARLIGASADEVAVMTSVSAGVSALASSLDFRDGRRKIVVSDFEFPTVAQIWHAQERRGARVVHVPAEDSRIPVERFAGAIDEETRLVSITHVCFRNGSRLEVEPVVRLAHERGALVLLDSYQALGTFPVDVTSLGVDFLVGGALKYLLASAGLAYLYVRRELIPELEPSCMGWFSQEDIFAMDIHANRPSPSARRFEAGTPPIPNIYAGLAGMGLIERAGPERIEAHLRELTGALKEGARLLGLEVVTPLEPEHHGALICLRARDPQELVARLAGDGFITSSRDHNLRISPHFYNHLGDIDRLLGALGRHRHLLVEA